MSNIKIRQELLEDIYNSIQSLDTPQKSMVFTIGNNKDEIINLEVMLK